MTGLFASLYPLQVAATDIQFGRSNDNLTTVFIFFAVIFIVVFIVIIANKRFTGYQTTTSTGTKYISGFALHRLAKSLGLNHEQIKMLDYVFKIDDVIDAEKSLSTPALLDRHFRRAYRAIEQSSNTEQEAQNKLSILFSTRNILENSSIGTMTSTRQIKDDTILTISFGKEKLNVNIVSNKNDFITVETPKNVLGSEIKIPKGSRINALFFTKNNKGFSFETRVTGYSNLHGHSVTLLAHSTNLKFLSQRRFRRRQTVIACFMNLVYVEGSGKKQRLVVDKRRLSGNIADISVGGCSIKTTAPVHVGARLKIEFTQGDNNVAALGQILRTNRVGINTITHIKFLRVSQKSMNLINAFVYEYAHE